MRMSDAARRPVFFIGHGVTLAEAGGELTEAVARLGIPVISSPNGMGCLDMDHPLSLGFIGRTGAFPATQAGLHCDLVLTIAAPSAPPSPPSRLPRSSRCSGRHRPC